MDGTDCKCKMDTCKTMRGRAEYLERFRTQFDRHHKLLFYLENNYLDMVSAVNRLEFFKVYLAGSPKNGCGCIDEKAQQIITLIDIATPDLNALVMNEEKGLTELKRTYQQIDQILKGEHIYSRLK